MCWHPVWASTADIQCGLDPVCTGHISVVIVNYWAADVFCFHIRANSLTIRFPTSTSLLSPATCPIVFCSVAKPPSVPCCFSWCSRLSYAWPVAFFPALCLHCLVLLAAFLCMTHAWIKDWIWDFTLPPGVLYYIAIVMIPKFSVPLKYINFFLFTLLFKIFRWLSGCHQELLLAPWCLIPQDTFSALVAFVPHRVEAF